jgi:hypothetical protein
MSQIIFFEDGDIFITELGYGKICTFLGQKLQKFDLQEN